MLDLLIKNGDIVDGTGKERIKADLAVSGGQIVEITPNIETEAKQTIDATGRIVSPGFVDVHTHYDAQVFWDTTLTPSPLHGVTTVIGGNCGFTIAPLSENTEDGEYLMRMLARVEGMPLESLKTGVPWNWKSYGDYLASFDNTLAINAGFMVGHSAIRRVVMGEDATKREATDEEMKAMIALMNEGLEAGGMGFSSSWSRTHNDAEGNMVPSRYAAEEELIALSGVCSKYAGTSLEFLPNVGPFEDWNLEMMSSMSAAAGRQLNWNVMVANAANIDGCYEKLRAGDHAKERGGKVVALTIPMNVELRLCFASGFGLDALPQWEEHMFAPTDEKIALLKDPERRKMLNDLAQQDSPLKGLANWDAHVIFDTVSPENQQYKGQLLGEIAEQEGKTSWDVLCDIAIEDELMTSFGIPSAKESAEDWEARVGLWRDGRAVIGASDAGAHLDFLATFNYSTYLLGNAVREAKALPLEEAVNLLTDVPASLYGIKNRGRLESGYYADVLVFDENTIDTEEITMRYDVPGDAARLYASGIGIDNVVCNGEVILSNGEFSEARPGKVLRSGQDTATPEL